MSQLPFKLATYHRSHWRAYQVSPHFRLGEFIRDTREPPSTATVDMVADFATDILEPLRGRYGACIIVSGHRTPARNRQVGGAPRSWHVWEWHPGEMAVDVTFRRSTPVVWAHAAMDGLAGGIGTYRSHLHLDSGPRRTWASTAP